MSGHSKWANIKHKKAKTDAKKGKVFTKLVKEVMVAAKGGADSSGNPRLRLAIEKAKAENLPADNIERAIKKGAGELDNVVYEEGTYEGYGPAGGAVLVKFMTDNRNRTASEVRHAFSTSGGSLGQSGSVCSMFEKRGLFTWHREFFAESFFDGREFNISVLCGPAEPEVLPHAEIRFIDYPPEKRKVVDYRAKWDEASFEYHHTIRCFDFLPEDKQLLEKLSSLAKECWHVFGLGGYARVDFRVDEEGNPWVLEINANPCISPDSGFVAAAGRAGIDYTEFIARILKLQSCRTP